MDQIGAKEIREAARVLLDANAVENLSGSGPLDAYGRDWMKAALVALLDAPEGIDGPTHRESGNALTR